MKRVVGFYADSFGPEDGIPEEIKETFHETFEKRCVKMINISKTQQRDLYNCGLFTIINLRAIENGMAWLATSRYRPSRSSTTPQNTAKGYIYFGVSVNDRNLHFQHTIMKFRGVVTAVYLKLKLLVLDFDTGITILLFLWLLVSN